MEVSVKITDKRKFVPYQVVLSVETKEDEDKLSYFARTNLSIPACFRQPDQRRFTKDLLDAIWREIQRTRRETTTDQLASPIFR